MELREEALEKRQRLGPEADEPGEKTPASPPLETSAIEKAL